ncbi:MAG: cellulase family glycosylhydrolase [Mesorhizobium sp.]
MAFLRPTIKFSLALALFVTASLSLSNAATFKPERGLNMDQWVTWPDESRWSERDVILPFPEWRKFVDDEKLRELKESGLDFLRIPVDPSTLLSPVSAGLRSDLIASVVDSVKLVNAAGLKAIVDLHLIPAGSNRKIGMTQVMEDPALFDRYLDAVRDTARALSGFDPQMVAIEPMNEPTIGCEEAEQRQWEERLAKLFAAARSSATRLTVILSGSCWGGAEGLAALDPAMIPDDNVMWSFHSYAPFLLSTQGATWAGDFIGFVTGLPYPLTSVSKAELDAAVERVRKRIRSEAPLLRRSAHLAYLDKLLAEIDTPEKLRAAIDAPFETVGDWAKRHGVPAEDIILGEFGMIRQEYGSDAVVPASSRAAYYRDVIESAETHGYAWSMWGYGGAFGIIESFSGERAEPDVMDMIRALPPRQ